jgi:hypothetical protein
LVAAPLVTGAVVSTEIGEQGLLDQHYFGRFIDAAARCKSIFGNSGIATAVVRAMSSRMDLEAGLAPRNRHTTAPFAAECQSFWIMLLPG